MPELSADKIIGKTLFAEKQLDKLNSNLSKIGTFAKGSSVGIVYSYIIRNGSVYWMFYDATNKPYYVKHSADSFKFSGGVADALSQQQLEKEKQLKEQKGAIPYYIEKYGKWILLYGIGAYLVATYIKSKK
jgi:hypothetical protein